MFSLGLFGVQLFFGVSGYLLGGQLLDAPSCSATLKTFYARCIARIVPLYLVLLAVVMAAGGIVAWPYLTMTQNIYFALDGWPPGPAASTGEWLSVTWSLAIEEQFYLVLPLLIFLAGTVIVLGIVCQLLYLAIEHPPISYARRRWRYAVPIRQKF